MNPILLALALAAGAASHHDPPTPAAPYLTPQGPYCRVEALYSPLFLSDLVPLDNGMPRLIRAQIRLRPGCPTNGLALVGFHTGSRIVPDGYVRLTPSDPIFIKSGAPGYYTPVWHAASGLDYPVPWSRIDP